MLYDVHIYAVVRVKVPGVEADSQLDAINKAETVTDLHALFPDYAEEINGYLVDEHGDEEHAKSHYYEVRHLHNPEPVPVKPYVIVTVSGGVAELAKGGESADVDIIDFDNIRENYQRAAQELSTPELDYLREHDSYTYDKLKPYFEPKP